MKRVHRGRPLAPEEVTEYKAIHRQAAEVLPELIAQHEQRMARGDSDMGNGRIEELARVIVEERPRS